MSPGQSRLIPVLYLLSSVFVFIFATQASERESENVEVTFYQLSKSEWSSSETVFKSLVAAEAATYCANHSECGLTSGFGFTTSQVGISSGPTQDSKSLKISFYIDFPPTHMLSSSSPTTYVLNSAATQTILASIRTAVESAVGHDITYIGDEFYSIDPDTKLNTIVIPVAFVVLLLIIILAIVLHVWSKRKEREEKRRQRALDREKQKKSRVSPAYTMQREDKQMSNFWPRRSGRKKRDQSRVNGHHTGNMPPIPTLSMKTNMMVYDLKQASEEKTAQADETSVLNHNDQATARNNALPPLSQPASEEAEKARKDREKKERRRRRKEKREKRRRQKQQEEAEDVSEESQEEGMVATATKEIDA